VAGSQRTAAAQAASRQDQFDGAFATMASDGVGALLVTNATLFTNGRDRLVALAARYSVPAGYEFREFVEVGGLFSYGSSQSYAYRQAGIYTGRIQCNRLGSNSCSTSRPRRR
jgi:putative ABC transport system substrate-binding protein